MGLADRPAPRPSSPLWQLFLILYWVPIITAQGNLTWGPPSEEHYINGQLTISPFDFRPGTTLSGAQQCLSFLNGPSVVVTIPCLTPVSGDAGALLDKWAYNFSDHTVRPWGTPEKQPGSLCLEGGSIALGAGNYVDVKVTVAACNPAVETQKWVWDDAFLKIDGSNRWLSAAVDRSGQFQLGANNMAAVPINFVLPPYTLIDTYTPQPTLAHALTGPNNVDNSNIGDGPGPCLYGVHRAGSFNTSVQCAGECEKEPRCRGFIFGISQGVGCCYVKAYFPPATSTGFSGYSTYVKGTSAVPGFPALALPTSLPTPAPAPSRPSPSINSPPQSTSNPSNSSSVGPPNSDPLSDGSSSNTGLIVGVTCGIVAAVAVVVCCLAFVCCKRRRRKAPERDSEKESSFGKVTPFTSAGLSPWRPIPASPAASSIDQALSPSWRCFSYDEIRQATSDFAPGNLLGEGAHGRVYRAVLPGGTQVAVKQLKEGPKGLNRRGFADELRALSGVRHRNLAAFRGYCAIEDEQYFLILDLADGGNLDAALHGPNLKAPLNWATRVKIAVAAARGLSYLHDGINPPIIHRDIKSANILLDSRQTALVADFGLARLMEDGDEGVTIQAGGTYGYVAPEYATEGLLTKKLDVYSFGVVLLELLTGVRALHKMRDGHRRSLVDLVRRNFPGFDPLLNGEFPPAEASYMGEIAMTCVAHYESRPDMSDVLRALENLVRGEVREESFFRSSAFSNGTEQPLVNAPFWASSALGGSHSSFSSSTPRPSSSREGSNYTSSTGMALQVTGVSKGR